MTSRGKSSSCLLLAGSVRVVVGQLSRSSDAPAFYSVLVHRLTHLLDASFRRRLAGIALASSLTLHLHQVEQRICTS
jgi:hypothetical protein